MTDENSTGSKDDSKKNIENFINESNYMLADEKKFFLEELKNDRFDSYHNGRKSLLDFAAIEGREEIIEELLDNKSVDVGSKNSYGMTALHHAAYHGKSDVIGLLFEYEAVFEKKTSATRDTPLDSAIKGLIDGNDTTNCIKRFLLEDLTEHRSKKDYEKIYGEKAVDSVSDTFNLINEYKDIREHFADVYLSPTADNSREGAVQISQIIVKSKNRDFLQRKVLDSFNDKYIGQEPKEFIDQVDGVLKNMHSDESASLSLIDVFPNKLYHNWEMDPLNQSTNSTTEQTSTREKIVDKTPEIFRKGLLVKEAIEEFAKQKPPTSGLGLKPVTKSIAFPKKEDKIKESYTNKLEKSRSDSSSGRNKH